VCRRRGLVVRSERELAGRAAAIIGVFGFQAVRARTAAGQRPSHMSSRPNELNSRPTRGQRHAARSAISHQASGGAPFLNPGLDAAGRGPSSRLLWGWKGSSPPMCCAVRTASEPGAAGPSGRVRPSVFCNRRRTCGRLVAVGGSVRRRRRAARARRRGAAPGLPARGRADQRGTLVLIQLLAPVGDLGDLAAQPLDRDGEGHAVGLDRRADLLGRAS